MTALLGSLLSVGPVLGGAEKWRRGTRGKNAFTDGHASDLCKSLKFTTLRETGGADGSGKRRREL